MAIGDVGTALTNLINWIKGGFVAKSSITITNTAPGATDGQDGDIWFVTD